MAEEMVTEISTDRKERRFIKIDGNRYDLYNKDEVPMATSIRIQKVYEKLGAFTSEKMTVDEADQLSKDLGALMPHLAIGIEESVVSRLSDHHRMSVLIAFMKAPGAPAPEEREQKVPAQSAA